MNLNGLKMFLLPLSLLRVASYFSAYHTKLCFYRGCYFLLHWGYWISVFPLLWFTVTCITISFLMIWWVCGNLMSTFSVLSLWLTNLLLLSAYRETLSSSLLLHRLPLLASLESFISVPDPDPLEFFVEKHCSVLLSHIKGFSFH